MIGVVLAILLSGAFAKHFLQGKPRQVQPPVGAAVKGAFDADNRF